MSFRKLVFWTHLAVGCLAGAVVLVMSVTGVLLAYERQITAWMDRDLRSAVPATGAHRLTIDAVVAKVTGQNRGTLSAITLRSDPAAPAEVSFSRDHVFLVDVYSGDVLGEGSRATRAFFQTVENWHRWLGAGNENRATGRVVTGASNLGFLVLVVSGPFLWIPRRWSRQSFRAVTWFRRGLPGKARDFNWHNVTGIWCAVPLFVIVLSGVVMSYPWANNVLYVMTGNEPPARGNGQRQESAQSSGNHAERTGRSRVSGAAIFSAGHSTITGLCRRCRRVSATWEPRSTSSPRSSVCAIRG